MSDTPLDDRFVRFAATGDEALRNELVLEHQGLAIAFARRYARIGRDNDLEQIALEDGYFVDRRLYPNVDFYSGIIYRALGIPTNMFTVMFALGRLPGWIAHWMEMHRSPTKKICRPRQVYSGETLREFVPINQR